MMNLIHGIDFALMNSEVLWVPGQKLHDTMPVEMSPWLVKQVQMMELEQLQKADGCCGQESQFSLLGVSYASLESICICATLTGLGRVLFCV